MSWKNKLSYKASRAVEQTVNGEKMRFYPNQLGILEDLATLSKPVTRAINLLVGNEGRNYKTDTKSFTEGRGDKAVVVEETVIHSSDQGSIAARIKERDDAIGGLIDMIGDGRNLRLLGKAWMDSMMDEFPRKRGGAQPQEVEEFLFGDGKDWGGLEIPTMIEMMGGWLRANSRVFGELGEKLVGVAKAKIEEHLRAASTSVQPNPTNGSDSKTPSSPPSPSDSDSKT